MILTVICRFRALVVSVLASLLFLVYVLSAIVCAIIYWFVTIVIRLFRLLKFTLLKSR